MKVWELTPEQRKTHRVLRDSDGDYLRCNEDDSFTLGIEQAEAWPDHAAEYIARALSEIAGEWTVMPIPEPERPEPKECERSGGILYGTVYEHFKLKDGRTFEVHYRPPQPDPLRDAAGEAIQVCRLLIALNRYEAGIQWSDLIAGANRVLARIDEKTPAGS